MFVGKSVWTWAVIAFLAINAVGLLATAGCQKARMTETYRRGGPSLKSRGTGEERRTEFRRGHDDIYRMWRGEDGRVYVERIK